MAQIRVNMTIPIDFCIAFNGMNVDVLSKMFFTLLFRYCNYDNVHFHLVDNGISDCKIHFEHDPKIPISHCNIDNNWKPTREFTDYHAESILTADQIPEWMVENCGTNKWCVLSHFDIIIRDDIITWIRGQIDDETGIIGTHSSFMAINREAYKDRSVDFSSNTNHDTGILLETDLTSKGWKHKHLPSSSSEIEKLFHHMGGAGSYHSKAEFDSMRERAIDIIENGDRNREQ